MPIFVQWKWVRRTKTFLVIFHFYDDFSRPNLRLKTQNTLGKLIHRVSDVEHLEHLYPQTVTTMTWAPSHVELGLLGELLRYANIIDGLDESEKTDLKDKLVGVQTTFQSEDGKYYEWKIVKNEKIRKLKFYVSPDVKKKEWAFCCELHPEYIDYLRNLLKPYLKD